MTPVTPNGTPRKLLDVERLTRLGWRSRITLRAGIRNTYEWFVQNAKFDGTSRMHLEQISD